jgi:hypothetical protein
LSLLAAAAAAAAMVVREAAVENFVQVHLKVSLATHQLQ